MHARMQSCVDESVDCMRVFISWHDLTYLPLRGRVVLCH